MLGQTIFEHIQASLGASRNFIEKTSNLECEASQMRIYENAGYWHSHREQHKLNTCPSASSAPWLLDD